MYPKLYKWDQKQQYKLKMGLITKEEYLKEREDNYYDLTDSEDEKKEMARINQIEGEKQTVQDYNCSVQDVQEVVISSVTSHHEAMSQNTLNPDHLVTETS